MRRFFCQILICCLFMMAYSSHAQAAAWEHSFFSGTQYPLKVVYLEGELPGPTIMVQGGIQGDETAGFVTAQLLSRSKVTRDRKSVV